MVENKVDWVVRWRFHSGTDKLIMIVPPPTMADLTRNMVSVRWTNIDACECIASNSPYGLDIRMRGIRYCTSSRSESSWNLAFTKPRRFAW